MSDSPMRDDAHVGQEITAYSLRSWVHHYEEGVPAELDIPEQPLTWLLDQVLYQWCGSSACQGAYGLRSDDPWQAG